MLSKLDIFNSKSIAAIKIAYPMSLSTLSISSLESSAIAFFRHSVGFWHSQRRYYTLNPKIETQTVESFIQIQYLEAGCSELQHLATLYELDDEQALLGGTYVTWESDYTGTIRKPSVGSTLFGIKDNILYRDRGFATPKPVTAIYNFTNPQTMLLKTEYSGSVFEEELKLIGDQYRTRQTLISRAGQEQMIGQYLEKRISGVS